MEWKDLSKDAKNILEWVKNPFTDEYETITVKVGGIFHRDVAKHFSDMGDVNILVSLELYSEIVEFVTNDANMDIVENDANAHIISFRLKEAVVV